MFSYDEAHYKCVAAVRPKDQLSEMIGEEELLSHISTVFYSNNVEIEVGKGNQNLQRYMKLENIRGLVGMTPQFPISNPGASHEENQEYIKEWEAKLRKHQVTYIPCSGRARDFREGGTGCFILVDVLPEEVRNLLQEDGEPTQLSFTFLPQEGEAELISCVEQLAPAV